MSYPSYPSSTGPGPHPGWYPLRPLAIGELIGSGLRVAVRHLAVLAPIAFLISLVASAADLLVLAGNGSLRSYANGDLTRVPVGGSTQQTDEFVRNFYSHVFPGLAVSLVLGLMLSPVLAGVAAPFAAQAATTRTGTNTAGLARLRNRAPVLLAVGVLVGLATAVGFVLLIVPGIILWLMLLPAGPVAAMEGLGVGDTMRRAAALSRGFKGRLLGVQLLIGLIVGAISLALTTILGQLVGGGDAVTRLVLDQVLAAVVAAVLSPWSSAVTAMLYIDIRMRREGLAQALAASIRPSY